MAPLGVNMRESRPSLLATLILVAVAPAAGKQLSADPAIYITEDVWPLATVEHAIAHLPVAEAAWTPCIGQVLEYASKRCTLLAVAGDPVLEAAVDTLGRMWDVDVAPLHDGGLPIIRYLPGAPAVGVHGDRSAAGLVPNATLVLYLTGSDVPSTSSGAGNTFFPDLGIDVAPRRGRVLSFTNVDAFGMPELRSRHGVRPVSVRARSDRLVVQVPLVHPPGAVRAEARAEHVSGAKHMIHLGVMGGLLLGLLVYQLWKAHPGKAWFTAVPPEISDDESIQSSAVALLRHAASSSPSLPLAPPILIVCLALVGGVVGLTLSRLSGASQAAWRPAMM